MARPEGSRRVWRVAEGLLVLVVAYLAMSPAPPRQIDLGGDKINHIAAFTVLAAVALAAHGRSAAPQVVGGLLAFGALIEIVQSQVPGRSSEWADLLADSLGIALGLALAHFAHAARAARRRHLSARPGR